LGVTTNQPLLAAILSNPEFIHGNYDTGFIPRHIEQIKTNWTKKLLSLETNEELLLAAWLFQMEQINNNENKVWKNMGLSRAWRNNRHQYQNIEMEIGQQKHTLWYQQVAGSEFRVSFGNTQDAKLEKGIKLQASNSQKIEFEFKDKRLEFSIRQHKNMMFIHHPDLGEVIVSILPRLLAVTEIQNKSNHVAPMPGKIIKVMVRAGDKVKINDELIIIESMKMENCVKASTAGLIKEVCVSHGQLVEKNEQLIRFESEG
jgi:acetyl/propionyl-CoA carboxylase alpha subunit